MRLRWAPARLAGYMAERTGIQVERETVRVNLGNIVQAGMNHAE